MKAPDLFFEKLANDTELPELYMIYISNFDIFGKDRVIYHVERVLKETGDFVDNGFHEVYVNAQVDDKSEISELMKLFKNSGIEGNEKFPKISRTIRYFKVGKGRKVMCKAVEELKQEATKETMKLIVSNMLKAKKDNSEIMLITGLGEEELEAMKAEILALW